MAKYAKIEGGGFQVQGYSAMQNLKCNRMWARNEAVKSKKKWLNSINNINTNFFNFII